MQPSESCHEPGNGGGRCIKQDVLDTLQIDLKRINQRSTEQFVGVFSALSRVETKVDRILEGIQIGTITPARPPLPSLDWDVNEPTNHGDVSPELAASIWAERARDAAERAAKLEAEVLDARVAATAATARFDERTRQSERARAVEVRTAALSIARWKLVAGLIATILTSGTIAALIAQLLGG